MRKTLLSVVLLGALASGCYSDADVGYTATYATATPTLAYVAPGVQVVYDYDYPVFFSDGFYWRYNDGIWYRSPYWNTGFSVAYDVPVGVRGIREPWAYRHYRGGTAIRDHRGYYSYRGPGYSYRAPAYRGPAYRAPAYRNAPAYRAPAYRAPAGHGPVVRDHRRR